LARAGGGFALRAQREALPLWKQQRLALAPSLGAAFQPDVVQLWLAFLQTGVVVVPLQDQ
jgi:hypothetical protein